MKFRVLWTKEIECVVEASNKEEVLDAWAATFPSEVDDWNPDEWELAGCSENPEARFADMGVVDSKFVAIDDYQKVKS